MAQVVLFAAVLVLFIQLASSQQACTDAFNRLNLDQCNAASAVCSNPCRGIVNTVFDNCGQNFQVTLLFDDGQVRMLISYLYNYNLNYSNS